MNCPNCGLTFQMWEKNCLQCGINFLEFLERRASVPKTAPAAQAAAAKTRGGKAAGGPRRRGRRAARLVAGTLAVVILAGAIAAWLYEPLPPNAVHDVEAELAFVPPPGWKVVTGIGYGWRFKNVARLTGRGGRIEVDVAPTALPVEEHLGTLIEEEFNGRRVELKVSGGARVAGVDGRRVAFRAVGGPKTEPVLGEWIFFPGSGRNYLIRFYTAPSASARGNADWSAFLASVRLTRSPFAFLARH